MELVPAVVAHGTGSRPAFVLDCLAAPMRAVGVRVVATPLRGHLGRPARGRLELADHAADLAERARAEGAEIVGGISLGAHAAASAAVQGLLPLRGLLLAMPAWSGPPGAVAAANAVQAEELESRGLVATLDRIRAAHPGWVAEELAASWPLHDPGDFVAALRAVARSAPPTPAELTAVSVPAAVVGVAGDPLHPAEVARDWAAALPRATYAEVTLAALGADREVLGRALAAAWLRVTGSR